MTNFKQFEPIEPLKENRFLISFNDDIDAPQELFRNFKIINEGENFILTTEMMMSVKYTFNPSDLMKIKEITLKFLGPVGDLVGGLHMLVSGSNMEMVGDYGSDMLLTVKFRFIINPDNVNLLCQDVKKEDDGE